jgi:parallel beta-helix repeat protein
MTTLLTLRRATAVLAVVSCAAAAPAAAATYYVDGANSACSNSGSGTQAKPYCTISAALAAHSSPGTTIIVKPAFYREQVTIPGSGNSSNRVVLQASASGVVVDGADDFTNPSQWVQYSGNVWRASSVSWAPRQVFADGARLDSSAVAPVSLPSRTFQWVSGAGLYVNAGGGNPAGHQARVGHRTYGFVMSGKSWITIDGFTVTRTEDRAIYLETSCSNVTLTHNTVTFSHKYGIQVIGGSGMLIGSNTVSDNNDHGIALTTGATGCVLEDNESFRNARPSERAANGIYLYGAPGNIARRNRLHDNQDTGLHFQSGSNNCIAYLNRSWNNGDHGYDHLGATGTLHVNDVAYGNYKDGFSIEGNASGTQLYNCIAVDNGLTTNEFDLWVDNGSTPGFVSNYNIFWNSTSQPPVKYIATLYSSVAAYSAVSGQDAQTLQADPRFVSPAAGNFHLQTGSPAIDDANSSVSNWPSTDVEGHARLDDPATPNTGVGPVPYSDRGALEYLPAVLRLTPSAGVAPLAVTADATGSVGPDGTAASFRFDFGDGTVVGPQPGPTATHTYAAGRWTATVTVTDQSGGTSTASATAAVNARPTAALAASPTSGRAPLTVALDASGSSDADGTVVSYHFAFGDGAVADLSTPVASHTYGTGSLSPSVTVTDNLGATATASSPTAIAVGPPTLPPTARLTVAPDSGAAPLAVTADASQSSDSDGLIASFRFDFGDGTIVGPQASPTATHTYSGGTWSASVTVTDGDGGTGSASQTVTADGAPVVTAPPAVTVGEASLLSVTVRARDLDGQPITSFIADLSGLPAGNNAAFTVGAGDSTGALTWTPTYADSGSYSVTFTAANALSASRTTTIAVANVDRAPTVAAPAAASVAEASPLTVTVRAADADGDPITSLTANLSGLPAGNNAVFTVGAGDSTGTLTWTPSYSHAGSYSVTFTAGNALSGSATTTISVANVDRAPAVAAPATASVAEATPLTVTVHASDVDGEPITSLTANLSGLPPGNNATFTAGAADSTGTLTWTPTYADSGSYSVTFTAANALSASRTTTIAVANVDRAPAVAAPAAIAASEAIKVTLTVRAADPDRDPISSLTADLSALPAGNDAVFTVGAGDSTGTLTWTPTYHDAGSYSITFTAANALSRSRATTIAVANVDRAPAVAAPAATSVAEASSVTIAVHASDVDGEPITSLTANLSGLPAGNDAVFTAGPGDSTGALTWTPTYRDAGSHSITFSAANALSASAATTILVTNVDRAPALAAPVAVGAAEASPVTVTVHASDVDGEPITSLTANLSGLPPGNNAVFTVGAADSTGTLSWTPGYDDAGAYSVTFTAANALSASATTAISVANVDRAPAVAAPAATVAEASALTLTVHAADPDGQPVTSLGADLSALPAGNDAVFTPDPGDTTGTLTWTPTYQDAGSYAITFTAANALSGSATTAIVVANVDRAPAVVAPAALSAAEGTSVTVTVRASDVDGEPIASLTADLSGLPAGNHAVFTVGAGDSTGTLVWTPGYDDAGTYSVTFTAANALSASATTAISVANVDRAPAVAAPAATVAEASALTLTVHAADPDGQPIASLGADLSSLPAGNDAVFTPDPGDTTGTLTWTPTYHDAGSYAITFTAANALSGSATTEIVVANVDRAPTVAAPATASVAETGTVTVTVHASDVDWEPIASLTADLSGFPAGHGAVFTAGPGDSAGTLTWTPTYRDAGSYTVTFTAANALPGSATTTISVANVDRAPAIAAPAAVPAAEASPVTILVHAADVDGEPIASLTADLSGLPAGNNAVFTVGAGDSTGTLTWTPGYDDVGTYSVTFAAANALSVSATTTIAAANVDRPPAVAAPVTATVAETGTLALTVHAADPDGQPIASLGADLSSLPAGNDAVFTPDPGDTTGTLTWTPTYHDAGSYPVAFTAANELSGSATTTVSVANVDRAPAVTAPAAASAAEGAPVTITVHASDVDGEPIGSLTADLSGLPAGNDATFTADPGDTTGTLLWTPGYDAAGSYAITFTAANALSASATTTFSVAGVDRAPVVTAPAALAASEASTITLTVRAADPDGEPTRSLGADLSSLPAGNDAVFSVDPGDSTGTLTWTPTYSDSGRYSVTFTAANALSSSAATAIAVANRDRAPAVAAPAAAAVAETGTVTVMVRASDVDGDPITSLTADLSALPAGNDAVFAADPGDTTGTLTWTPTHADAGSYRVAFTAANALSGSAAMTLSVANVDRAPAVAAPATIAAAEAGPVRVTVHASDGDGEPIASLTADLSGLPAGSDAAFAAGAGDSTGTLTWTPTYRDSGRYSVTFTAANALSASATTTIAVANVDRAPVVSVPGTATVPEARTLTLTVRAADPDGQPLASLAADLSALPAGNGAAFRVEPGDSTGILTWTPTYADAGSYAITFTAANALIGSAATTIAVANVDRAPAVAAPATVVATEASRVTVTVHASDVDGEPMASLTADLSGLPPGSDAVFTVGRGDSTATLTWTPTYRDSGRYSVTFTAANALSASATTTITVANVDRAPVVSAPGAATVAEARTLTLTVRAADPDGQPLASLAANLSALPAGSDAAFTAGPGDTTGTLTWTPTYADAGSYSISFTASNALSASAATAVVVANVDRAPAVAAPAAASGAEASPLTVTLHASDVDGEPITSLTADLSGLPAGNDAAFTVGAGDSTATLRWTPTYDDAGSYTIAFTAANALSASAATTLSVADVDRAPAVAAPASASVPEAHRVTATVRVVDPDGQPIASLTADLSRLPAGNDAVFAVGAGDSTGTLTWTPTYDDAGSYPITFTAANALTASAATTISVADVDRAPAVAAPASASAAEAQPVTVTVHAADPDGQPIASLAANLSGLPPGNDAVFTTGPGNTTGTLRWTPTYRDAGSYWITFTAANALSVSATTTVTVANVDRAPALDAPVAIAAAEGSRVTLVVHATDVDGEPIASLTADLSHLPPGSDAAFAVGPGHTTGTLTWTPTYADVGSYPVTFTTANALSASATTTVSVANTDRAPAVTAPATASVAETQTVTVAVRAADPDGQPIASLAANLSGLPPGNDAVFTAGPGDTTGTLRWTPTYRDAGSYPIAFTAANALAGSATTTVTVTNVDRAPALSGPAMVAAAEGSRVTFTVHAADVDGEPITSLTADLGELPNGNDAVFTVDPGDSTGTLTWTPTFYDAGSYSIDFTAGNALSVAFTTTLSVANTDRAPVVTAPVSASVAETHTVTVTVRAADPDGQPIGSLTADLSGLAPGSGAVFTAGPGDTTGTLRWTPSYADAGTHAIAFTAANALTGVATTTITVANVDRAPVLVAPAQLAAAEGARMTLRVHAADPDREPITSFTANLAELPNGSDAVFTADPGDTAGTLTWTPTYDDAGSYSVDFMAGNALSVSATTTLTVANTDRAPVVTAPASASVAEAQRVTVAVRAADPDGQPVTSLAANLSGLPPGNDAAFTAGPGDTTGTLTWTPTFRDAGSYSIAFTASNAASGSATTVIAVSDVDHAPTLAVPKAVAAIEGGRVSFRVHAADPDGQAITSLTADLAEMPEGSDAAFTADPGDTTGTVTWTPTYDDAGDYSVDFTASNALSVSATTAIMVANVDRAPVVTAPASVPALEWSPVTVTVSVADPDGEAITSLSADLSGLPAGNNAAFTPGQGNKTGTLTWTPTYRDAGNYTVRFTAANAAQGTAVTAISVADVVERGPFYVDGSNPGCSSSGPGTGARPYCTISAAVAAHTGPGITIVVKPGIYRELVTIPASGATDDPAVLQASGSGVVVDGADDFSDPSLWAPYSGSVWLAGGVSWGPKQVFADGARLTASAASPASLPARTFRWVQGAGLYVNAGGGSPAGHQAVVGHRAYGFVLNGKSGVAIDGFTVTRSEERGFYLSGSCSNITLTHNTVTFGDKFGIHVVGGSGMRIASNSVSDNDNHGIALTSGVTGSIVEDNESFRNSATGGAANGIYVYGCPANVFRRNRLHDNQDTGLHLQGGSNNCIAYLNRSWKNGDHGYDHQGVTGTLHVCDVSYGNYRDGFSIQSNSTGTQIYDCIAAENGLLTNEFDLRIDSGSRTGFASNYNLFWNSTTQPPVKFVSTAYSSVAAYSAASGQDDRTLQANPRFVSAATGDFHLLAGSPAIDNANSGVPSWPANDAEDRPRADDPATPNTGAGPVLHSDRGAFEFVNAPPVARLAIAPASGRAPLALVADASASADADGSLVSYRFDFGDGTVVGPQPGPSASHTYGAGTWTPTVTVTDNLGTTATASAPAPVAVSPANSPPVARLTVAPASGAPPLAVVADASKSTDAEGNIASYRFDFGDGTVTGPQPAATASHTYGSGTWTMAVTVTDSAGAASSASQTVRANGAPVVTVAPAVSAAEGSPLTLTLHAADADGDTITSFTADLSRLPAGSGAVFTAGARDTTGTLTWTPGYQHAGSYTVTFTAANALSGSASTVITVANVDRAPVVSAPPAVTGVVGSTLIVPVTASDPDGDAIASLTANRAGLPEGNGAAFTPGTGNTSGTLNWTPAASDTGSFPVTFTAANALPGSAVTTITVRANQPPAAAVTATPSTGNEPLTVTASAAGSSDPDGTIVSYRFDFGDGTVAGPQSAATATHVYAAGSWTLSVVVTDNQGAVSSVSREVLVAAGGSGPNFVTNPSFETNTTGWGVYNGSTIQRVAGGFDGGYSLQMNGPGTPVVFGTNDSPNWVASTPTAGTRYRFSAWVRSSSSGGQGRLRVREYLNNVRIGSTGYFSNTVALSPQWKLVTEDYVAQTTGATLDFQVENVPVAGNEVFQVDNISIRIVSGASPAALAMDRDETETWALVGTAGAPALDLQSGVPTWTLRIGPATPLAAGDSLPDFTRFSLRFEEHEIGATQASPVQAEGGAPAMDVQFDRDDLRHLFAGLAPGAQSVAVTLTGDGVDGRPRVTRLTVRLAGAVAPLRPTVSPNPVRGQASIDFATSRRGFLRVEVFDASGRRVRQLADEAESAAGWHHLDMDGKDDGASALPSGLYFYRVRVSEGMVTGRFILIR